MTDSGLPIERSALTASDRSAIDAHMAERARPVPPAQLDREVQGDVEGGLNAESQPVNSVEEVAQAVERGEIAFPLVMKALYLQWDYDQPEYLRQRHQDLYPKALQLFLTEHHGIRESFYANEFVAGVALTGTHELFAEMWWDGFLFDTTPARAVEAAINDLQLKATLYLAEDHRQICMERLLRLYKTLIASLRLEYHRWSGDDAGDERQPHAAHLSDLRQIAAELEDVRRTYTVAGSARGEARYILGAAAGTASIVIATGFAAALIASAVHTVWLGTLAAGAVGALVSVLQRLTRQELRVRFEADANAVLTSGASRPIIGAVSGLAFFALIEGGILPLNVPAGEPARGLFFASIAFLAGFSERLARDVFDNAASGLAGGGRQENPPASTGLSAALARDSAERRDIAAEDLQQHLRGTGPDRDSA